MYRVKDWKKTLVAVSALISVLAAGFLVWLYIGAAASPVALHAYAKNDLGDDLSPSIAYGKGQWIVVWHTNDKLKKGAKPGVDPNIVISGSTDGKKWDHPKFLDNDPQLIGPNDIDPHVATDGKGNWLVAWASAADLKGTGIGTDYDILQVFSGDNAATWKGLAAANLNAAADDAKPKYTNDAAPRVATDKGGHWLLTWEGNSWAKSSENPGCSETAPATIWKSNTYRSYVQYTDDLNKGWKHLYCIQPTTDSDYVEPAIANDQKGNWVIPLSSQGPVRSFLPGYPCDSKQLGNDHDVLVMRSANSALVKGTDPWGTCYPWHVNSYAGQDGGTDRNPSIDTDGKVWIAVWQSDVKELDVAGKPQKLGGDDDILIATSTNAGKTWSSARVLNTNATQDSGEDRFPIIRTNGSDWVVVWESTDNLDSALGPDVDILIATSADGGKTWTPPRALHANARSDSKDDQRPQIATDGKTWVAVWHSYEDGGTGPDADILVANFTLPLP